MHVKFDALTARVVDSRQDLRRIWRRTREDLRTGRLRSIRPVRLTAAGVREVVRMGSFTQELLASLQPERQRAA
jgi:hypothetical protein